MPPKPILQSCNYKAGCVQSSEDDTAAGNPDNTLLSDICGESLALVQVIAYIEDRWVSVSTPVVFRFSELNKLYCEQLARHKIYVSYGRDVLLTFEQHIGVALQ